MIKYAPKAVKFSLSVSKGSPQKRFNSVSHLNEVVFENMCKNYDNKSHAVPLQDAKDALFNVMPEKKHIAIQKFNRQRTSSTLGESDYIYGENDALIGQSISIQVEHKQIPERAIPIFMHELTHVWDNFFNPKYTARSSKFTEKGLSTPAYDRWYDGVLYNDEKFSDNSEKNKILDNVRKSTKKFLSRQKDEDKLDVLQNARYYLESERDAYSQEYRYATKLKENHKDFQEGDAEYLSPDNFLFNEKIQILKEVGAEIIQKARQTHAKSIH
jgi:hypothetical protein